MLALFATRRFAPLCLTQACTALNDNLVRNALVVLALFRAGSAGPVLVALAAGLFIFPYMLLSATAGQLADRSDKARLIRLLKFAELGLMTVSAFGFLLDSVYLLLLVLVALGIQASLFGPVKYGILPDHLRSDELLAGNGLIEATTFIAILLGTMAGGTLIGLPRGAEMIASAGLAIALAGLCAALAIPPASPRGDAPHADWHLLRATARLVREARRAPDIWQPILGISWFWTIGATLVAEFPVVARTTLGAEGNVVSLLLTMFSLGVGVGSLLCARVLRGRASTRYVPFALIGISLFTWDFAIASVGAEGLVSVSAFLATPRGWRILADLILLAGCGGFYSVPLYTLIQHHAEAGWRARMIAANNVVNAMFMVVGAVAAALLAAFGLSPTRILSWAALVNLAVAAWAFRLPRARRARHPPEVTHD